MTSRGLVKPRPRRKAAPVRVAGSGKVRPVALNRVRHRLVDRVVLRDRASSAESAEEIGQLAGMCRAKCLTPLGDPIELILIGRVVCRGMPASLIWNDLLSSPRSVDGGLANACRRQLAGIRASDHVASAVSRGAAGAARRARSPGCRVRHVVSRMPFGARTAETTDGRGRFDDESR